MSSVDAGARLLLQHLASAAHLPLSTLDDFPTVRAFYARAREAWSSLELSVDRALLGGILSPCPAFAYAVGLQAGLRALVPRLPEAPLAALCITEEGGGHPKAIRATLALEGEHFLLSGRKKFITLGIEAELLLVAASQGWNQDKNDIRVALIEASRPGVTVHPMPPLPVVQEVSHAFLTLDNVTVASDELLTGDGYTRYIKAFRTVEDVHVSAGMLGLLMRYAWHFEWPKPQREELLALMTLLRTLGRLATNDPGMHLVLAGYFSLQERVFDGLSGLLEALPEPFRERWLRDQALRLFASRARGLRTEAAWQQCLPGSTSQG